MAESPYEQNQTELIAKIIKALDETGMEFAQYILDYLNDSLYDNLKNNEFYSVIFSNRDQEREALRYILGKYSRRVLGPRTHELSGKAIKELGNLGIQFELGNNGEQSKGQFFLS